MRNSRKISSRIYRYLVVDKNITEYICVTLYKETYKKQSKPPIHSMNRWFACMTAYQCSVVKVHRGIVTDELKSDLQVLHREVWERRSNSKIVA